MTSTEVEVVGPDDRKVGQQDGGPSPQSQAIEQITDTALATPGMPGRDEFLQLCMQARLLSMSAALPKGVRGNPHLCLHIVLLARDYGVSPATAVNLIDFIPEKKDKPHEGGQLSLSPEFMCARVENLGLGHVELLRPASRDKATAVALRPGGEIKRNLDGQPVEIVGEIGRSEFTWEDAVDAGLADSRCTPGVHWKPDWQVAKADEWKQENKCGCRTGYRNYPKRMMGWRAKGYAVADYFPQASLGLYSAEELGADVDDQGHPIDLESVELPKGYDQPALAAGPPPAPPASAEAKAKLNAAIASLDADSRGRLLGLWQAKQQEGRLRSLKTADFDEGDERLAWALLRGVGWKPQDAQEPAEPAQTGGNPSDPPTGQEAATGPAEEASPKVAARSCEPSGTSPTATPDSSGQPTPTAGTPTTPSAAGSPLPADNGHRDELEADLAGAVDRIRGLDLHQLEDALVARGFSRDEAALGDPHDLRSRLAAVVVRNAKTARTAQTPGQGGAPIRDLPHDNGHRGTAEKLVRDAGSQALRDSVAQWGGRRHANLVSALKKRGFTDLLTTDTDDDLLDILVQIAERNVRAAQADTDEEPF